MTSTEQYQPTGTVDKRRVTMRSTTRRLHHMDGARPVYEELTAEAVDYVRPDFLEAYLRDAASTWQTVEVSDEPDAGPGGYDGQTYIPVHLDHPLAGQTFASTDPAQEG